MSKEHYKEIVQNEPTPKSNSSDVIIGWIVIGIIIYVIFLIIRGLVRTSTRKPEEVATNQLPVFTTENIGKTCTALGMVKSSSMNEVKGMKELQNQAIAMNADAIVAMQMNISNDTSGKVSSDSFSGKHTRGSTSTKTTYHFMGTAVKFNEVLNNE